MASEIYREAIERLRELLDDARQRGVAEPNAAALAMVNRQGRPSVRTVTIRHVGEDGLVFFINWSSGKGRQLADNPRASVCFFWGELTRQAIVEGEAEPLIEDLADLYWARQPREYQLAAWAQAYQCDTDDGDTTSPQQALSAARRDFQGERVSRPETWKAIRLPPR